MDLRNLRRWYLFNKGLKRYNKRRENVLNHTHVSILTAVYILNSKGIFPSLNGVYIYLNQNGRAISYGWVSKRIDVLIELGMLKKLPSLKITRCNLTVSGRIELMLLERILRSERGDR